MPKIFKVRNCSTVDSWFSHLGKLYPNGLALGFDWPIVRVSRFFGWHLPSSSFYYYAESLSNSSLSWKRPNEMHELGSLGRWPCDVWSEGRHIFPPFCIMASNKKIDHEESADWTSSSIKAYFLRESLTFTLTTRSHEELLLHLHSGYKSPKRSHFDHNCERSEHSLTEISKKIDLNARYKDGWTLFVFTCKYGHNDVVKLLR